MKPRISYALFCCIALLLMLLTATIVQAQGQQPLLKLNTDYQLTHVVWSPDGRLIAVGEEKGTVIFDTSLQVIAHMLGDGIVALAWNPQGTELATGGGFYANKGEIQIWQRDLASNTFTLMTTFHNNHENVFFAAWSPDGTMLATASRDSEEGLDPIVFTIEIWDADTWTLKTTLKHQYLNGTYNLSWSPDSTRIAGGGTEYGCSATNCSPNESGVYIADVETGERLFFLGEDYPSSLDWSTKDLLAVNWHALTVYNPDSGYSAHEVGVSIGRIKWHPNGIWLAGIAGNDFINIKNGQTGKFALSTQGEPDIWDLDWSPDGNRLVAVTESGTIQIWDTPSLSTMTVTSTSTPQS